MIVRCLSEEEIKKMYPKRTVKPDYYGIRPGYDYVVISMDIAIELAKNTETSIRYWILRDEKILNPYEAFNFKIIDSYFPKSWIMELMPGGIQIGNKVWLQPYYVGDYFDDPKIEKEYNKIIRKIFQESVRAAKKNGVQLNLGIEKF